MKIKPDELEEPILRAVFDNLKPFTQPKWGMMTAQHLAEHLADVAQISNGKRKVELFTPIEKLEAYRQKALFSDRPWPQNTLSPLLPAGQLSALRCKDLQTALEEMYQEYNDFQAFFANNPQAQPINAVFGALDYAQWCIFHAKHINHHLEQFGL